MVIDAGTVAFLVTIAAQTAGIGKMLVDVHGIKGGLKDVTKAVHRLDKRLCVVETKVSLLPYGPKI